MLVTHHSNRLEALADALAGQMAAAPLPPMTEETVVVPHRSMGHWLSIELAERHGVTANVAFPFLGGLVWRLFARHWTALPEQSGFDRQALRWRVLARLPAVIDAPAFAPLRAYLADSDHDNGVKAYQLADRLASLYDEYLVYRPDWIAAWEAGESAHWQAALWREIAAGTDGRAAHRAALVHDYIAALGNGEVDPASLPPRLTVFGVSSAPPAYIALLAALAEHIPVDVLVLNPSLHYWGDVVSERGLAKLRELWRRRGLPDASDYYSVGHPLLASLGGTGREFLELLQNHSGDDAYHFTEPAEDADLGHLARLQADILELRRRGADGDEPAVPLDPADTSVTLHACHSPMREVQVLHDRLRRLFADTDLQPRDVVVMTPDIDRYAPYIEAVFGNATGERHIPWSVTDRALPGVHPVIRVFTRLLELPRSRLTASEVLSILEVPAVHRAFDLDADAVERIRAWVRESGIRWGADAGHRTEEALPPARERHSWRFGLNRLLLGYAMDDDTALYRDIAPMPGVEGGEAAWLGGFAAFWEQLLAARATLREAHTPDGWQTRLNAVLDALFHGAEAAEHQALQVIRDTVTALVDATAAAGFDEPLPPATLRAHLLDALEGDGQQGGYLTGQVTFCAMVPMRSVPFEAVCLIGLNDQDFPRQGPTMAFDLMATEGRRPGDRSLREDDRYLFLEALLSARSRLYVSYVGRSIRDDSERLPSVLVNELCDSLDRTFTAPDGHPASASLLTEHPLQPFSARYSGAPEAAVFSYADDWLRPAGGGDTGDSAPAPFIDAPLPEPEAELREVTLEGLVRFLRNPAEAFLRLRLGTRMQREAVDEADSEPFDLDGLGAYQLREHLLAQRLRGHDPETLERLLDAAGTLPEGPFGRAVMDDTVTRVERLREHLEPLLGEPLPALEVDLELAELHLTGWLTDRREGGLLTYRPAPVRPADRLRLWVSHLALNAVAPGDDPGRISRHLGEGGREAPPALLAFAAIDPEQARERLGALLALYWRGLRTPLPLPLASAHAYATALRRHGDADRAMTAAARVWEDNPFQGVPGEGSDPSWATVFRDAAPLDDPGFPALATALFDPMSDAEMPE
ncbi:exodeoxyribonuclease V subunit gamma [Arhodomonas aquaeolei]|uniref:exodeoxyribonuclease V subunit gamma n=2 Tax=Arhodomonas TaxID=2368 RepID=UPI0003600681|nr:exodeoxyribonuclease V subunit gamma [Arhodomonas aquaeolei]